MTLESVMNGPFLGPTVEENGVTRLKKYSELSTTEVIQADCDERIQMLMQGTSLTKQGRECKLYDEFDKFAYKKRESLRDFYLRFSLLLNDLNLYNMKLEQFQVNTKFLNTLPPEWSKFVTDVKLVRDLHTINVDQLHAYLGQHEYHVNEGRQKSMTAGMLRQYTSGPSKSSKKHRVIVYYNCKGEGHMLKQCTKPNKKRDEAWFKDKVLLVQAQTNGQVLYEEELEFLEDPGIAETQSTQSGFKPKRSLDVIMFTSEEPTWYGISCLGRFVPPFDCATHYASKFRLSRLYYMDGRLLLYVFSSVKLYRTVNKSNTVNVLFCKRYTL
uniref:Ureidoglycolate amidohydrolase n=1 Tax=Tanacetum cinerariifolium TaxID=118510 RepID=A0A6L2K9J5_TANCI|nr:ureidoglycolate amidohydrolase [Tanacetum cinerariifolium]